MENMPTKGFSTSQLLKVVPGSHTHIGTKKGVKNPLPGTPHTTQLLEKGLKTNMWRRQRFHLQFTSLDMMQRPCAHQPIHCQKEINYPLAF